MKYNIFDFDQQSVISLRRIEKDSNGKEIIFKLDVIDLLILNVVSDYMNRKSIEKIIINDKIYFWISYKMIIEDLPILDIKKQALADRLVKLVHFNLLEKYISRNEQGTKTCFRIGNMYETLKYNGGGSKIQEGVVDEYEPKTINTKNNYTNTIKEDTIVSKKKNEEEEIYSEDYIKFRKWMKEKCPYCDNPKNFSSSTITQKEFYKLKELYTGRQIADTILEIENRKDLRKRYTDLYLTTNNWLKNNYKKDNNGVK